MFLLDFFSCHNTKVLILIIYLKFKAMIMNIFNFTWGKTDIMTVMPKARGKMGMYKYTFF